MKRLVVIGLAGVAAVVAVLALGVGVVETGPGKAWLAAAIGRALSDPAETIRISGLQGFVPFDFSVREITVSDRAGPRLSAENLAIAIGARELLAGRLRIARLGVARLAVLRGGESGGAFDAAALVHPALPVTLDRIEIGALALARPVLGTAMTLTLSGSGAVGDGRAAAMVALRRIDGIPGSATFDLAYDNAAPHLRLNAAVSEPTGTVLAALLGQPAKLPLALTLAGDGPLADWRGRLQATAGSEASLAATVRIAGRAPYRLSLEGEARVGKLLPPPLAAIAGDRVALAAEITFAPAAIALDRLSLRAAGFGLEARGRLALPGDAVSATASLDLPDLARLLPTLGGKATIKLALAGTLARPEATAELAGTGLRLGEAAAATATSSLRITPEGDTARNFTVAASGHLSGLTLGARKLPAGLGEALDWRIAGRLDPAALAATGTIAIDDAGTSLAAAAAGDRDGASGTMRLKLPALAPFDGGTLAGALDLAGDFRAAADGTGTLVLSGTIAGPKSTLPRLDAVLGNRLALAATLERGTDGTITAREVSVAGAGARLTGNVARAAAGTLAADFALALPRLGALDPRLAGSAALSGHVAGPPAALTGTVTLKAPAPTLKPPRITGLQADLTLAPGLTGKLAAHFAAAGIATTVTAQGALAADGFRIEALAIAAAGARLDGSLSLAGHRLAGRFKGSVPDLRPWSALAGVALAGAARFDGQLAGTHVAATVDARDASIGAARASHLRLAADITDPFGLASGTASLALTAATAGRAVLHAANLTAKSSRPGRFAINATAQGTLGAAFTLAGNASLAIGRGAGTLSLARLGGRIGPARAALGAPLAIAWHGQNVTFTGLTLALDRGSITGEGAIGPKQLALHLVAAKLPVAALARLWGAHAAGTLGFELSLAGTPAAPQAHLVLDGEQLRFEVAARPDLPAFGAVVSADWRDGRVTLKGRLAGPQQAAIGWTASAPLVLELKPMALALPRGGAVTAKLQGAGEIGAFGELLPDPEDRATGRFTLDVSVAGTVGDPALSGKVTVADGRYESFAAGAILTGVHFTLAGEQEKLVLRDFAASDGKGGSLAMIGALDFAAAGGPHFALTATLHRLRALNRDEAKATASGELRISGPLTGPRVDAALTLDEADLAVPEPSAPSARPVAAIIVNSATGTTLATLTPPQHPALGALALNVTLSLPGRTFVRGRGLDSEWRGRLAIAGTALAPTITGRLEVVHGTYDVLGKSFVLTQGAITFLGGGTIDPIITITAQAQSSDITAIVALSGTATQPQIRLSSQPALPNDEILARLLFGTNMSQIGAAQGVEIASAAASLAGGGGLDVLGRLRRGLGLDRLGLGSGPSSVVPGIGVPALQTVPGQQATTASGTAPLAPGAGATGTPVSNTTLNAGKYVANGVYVGVSQGLQPGSSAANVTIDVTRHITLDTQAGPASGAGIGIGLNWKLDY